jgi:Zn-dependent protease with chaperone function
MIRILAVLGICGLAACTTPNVIPSPVTGDATRAAADRAARNFVAVVERVEPVAEQTCRQRAPGANCNFQIYVDERPQQGPNAFHTVDDRGRPIIVFTIPLIAEVRNQDELAFVMGHEAAHHILGHFEREQASAAYGAVLLGGLAEAQGQTPQSVEAAARLGAEIGARAFSKDFELEADAMGTVITHRAGYDPVLGGAYFARIPDPGDQFLGSHPPNAARQALVLQVAAGLGP